MAQSVDSISVLTSGWDLLGEETSQGRTSGCGYMGPAPSAAVTMTLYGEGQAGQWPWVSGPFPQLRCSVHKREEGWSQAQVSSHFCCSCCGAQGPFSSLRVRFMSVRLPVRPAHRPAGRLGGIKGLVLTESGHRAPGRPFLGCQGPAGWSQSRDKRESTPCPHPSSRPHCARGGGNEERPSAPGETWARPACP